MPYEDLMGEDGPAATGTSARRLAELEADGIVAEVIFPNTIPPFYPEPSLKAQVPGATEGDLELRWAGLRAHNRWLADFCADAPGAAGRDRPDHAARRRRRGGRGRVGGRGRA